MNLKGSRITIRIKLVYALNLKVLIKYNVLGVWNLDILHLMVPRVMLLRKGLLLLVSAA